MKTTYKKLGQSFGMLEVEEGWRGMESNYCQRDMKTTYKRQGQCIGILEREEGCIVDVMGVREGQPIKCKDKSVEIIFGEEL